MNPSSRIQHIRSRFDRRAAGYDRNLFTRWVGRRELEVLRELVPPAPQPGTTPALDYGCGTGRATRILAAQGYRVTGYDVSAGMLERAWAAFHGQPAVTFTADVGAIRRQWPLIVALGVLDYYPDTAPLWQEWRGLLAPGGWLVVTAPNAASPLAWLYAFASRWSCPAYPAALPTLCTAASRAGLSVADVRAAFPRSRHLGHTLVLRLTQLTTPISIGCVQNWSMNSVRA